MNSDGDLTIEEVVRLRELERQHSFELTDDERLRL